jgi:nicotinamidase-related amidase
MADDHIDSRETDFFSSRGFGLRMGFGKRPAIVVVDMIRAFTDPRRPLGANLDSQLSAISALLAAARPKAIPIIFSTITYQDPKVADAGVWALKQLGLLTLIAGTDGAVDLDPRLDFLPGDDLLTKKYASCFFGTDLVSRLVVRAIDTLIIAGCTTSGCVRATAVDAVQMGLRPMIVREAVGDRSERAHEQSLFDLNAKYADVVSLEETTNYFSTITQDKTTAP